MLTFANEAPTRSPQATAIDFTENAVRISLSDGQTLSLDLNQPWLRWLASATPEERNHWSLEPRGNAVYWEDLDDGIEICHALELSGMTTLNEA